MKVMTVNFTALNKAKLEDILDLAEKEDVSVIAAQETKHPADGHGWVGALLAKRSCRWRIQWSLPPPKEDRNGYGGTALLWRDELGRGKPVASASHRECVRNFGTLTISSCYGDASRADPSWFAQALTLLEMQKAKARVAVGDFNWRRAYDHLVTDDWKQLENIVTTKAGNTSPTRCLTQGLTDCRVDGVHNVPGIKTHLVVVYVLSVSRPARCKKTRLRRTSNFVWDAKPDNNEEGAIANAVDAAAPALATDQSLIQAWRNWFARFEAALTHAEVLGLAVNIGSGEREKGSAPSTRNTADVTMDGSSDNYHSDEKTEEARASRCPSTKMGKQGGRSAPRRFANQALGCGLQRRDCPCHARDPGGGCKPH